MFRIAPYRHRRGADSFMPRAFGDWFNWPEISWQGFNVDVKETAEGYTLQADLPGVSKENISLSVDNGYLTIAVRQEELKAEDTENYICRERRQMSSQRSFYVGDVKPDDVRANYRDGVLEVKFPKATEGSGNRQIPIH